MDAESRELRAYLEEVLADYRRFVGEIGRLGLAAPQLLYYRDEVQDFIEELQETPGVDLKPVWLQVRELDGVVRARASDLVAEIGHANFKQYQIVNDPPQTRWWWYLNRVTAAPPVVQAPPWQFWRRS